VKYVDHVSVKSHLPNHVYLIIQGSSAKSCLFHPPAIIQVALSHHLIPHAKLPISQHPHLAFTLRTHILAPITTAITLLATLLARLEARNQALRIAARLGVPNAAHGVSAVVKDGIDVPAGRAAPKLVVHVGAVQIDADVVLLAAQIGHVDADEVADVAEVWPVWHEVAVLGVFAELGCGGVSRW
jgi:hypothetical protein